MKPLSNLSLLVTGLLAFGASVAQAAEVNLYTTREPVLIQTLLTEFTQKTGVKVNTVFIKDGLLERVKAEGRRSPADVMLTVDFGNLVDLVESGLTQRVSSKTLNSAIPANLRAANGHWYALSMRARAVYASKDRTPLNAITYEDLANPKWKNKICIRSGNHPYNTALIAAYIAHHGEKQAETWLRGVKANLARPASGGDRDVARDILGKICDIGVANTYYVGTMRTGDAEQKRWGNAINVVLPRFKNGGTHVNVSGAVVSKHAPNRKEAVQLLEFLASDHAQAIYAQNGFEYPVKPGVKIDPIIASFGKLNIDSIRLSDIARHRKAANLLVDKVQFNR
ncbi:MULTISPECIES: extracellular solute-binding protein [Acinetobacter]|uniref:Extracellular solute-binding protein n=1 Tax=Acinetobacter towneri TaxID=202956 RepID=A0AAP4M3G3_9GAMM|nr:MULTISPECIES: extracellular solute-binding protein [Acinetobacter]GIT83819.1 iron ABC transporter substrate-binding protein [Acinetobacter seohaensis]MDM1283298.1 extracellular solute-binding protein [Acinetobacter towneri]MDM1719144.1 extracellular solute-binding protein [Acinetobacter towneri]MDM1720777.1 extracellular solute-binding protein [Acinetobacter towneri]MDM1731285.1 extracellular solute-binding protein [Acinetobacter towneri]